MGEVRSFHVAQLLEKAARSWETATLTSHQCLQQISFLQYFLAHISFLPSFISSFFPFFLIAFFPHLYFLFIPSFFSIPLFSPFISNFVVLKIEPSSLHIMYNHSNVIKFPNTILFIIYCNFSEGWLLFFKCFIFIYCKKIKYTT